MSPEKVAIRFVLNGNELQHDVTSNCTLLDFLRNELGLTGTKQGCGIGECGACTVLLDGQPVYACLLLAAQVDGRTVETVEGMGNEHNLHPLQRSFIEKGAVQCGFCTPGMLLSAKALLDTNPHPSRDEIKEAISGNLCRCTGYQQIVEAIEAAEGEK
jgi:carbon-monoxide dehydrogenase small subunit